MSKLNIYGYIDNTICTQDGHRVKADQLKVGMKIRACGFPMKVTSIEGDTAYAYANPRFMCGLKVVNGFWEHTVFMNPEAVMKVMLV